MSDSKIWDGAIDSYRESLVNELETSLHETAVHINLADCLHDAIIEAQIHQAKHITDMRLNQRSLDIYKALSWITWFMAVNCKQGGEEIIRLVIRAGINELNVSLVSEEFSNAELPFKSRDLLEACLANEINGLSDHGIALNGLFLSFYSASEILKLNHN